MSDASYAERPWGSYRVLSKGEGFLVKRLTVHRHGILSLQKHFFRSEVWTIAKGLAEVTLGYKKFLVADGETVNIPLGEMHRIENVGIDDLEIIEVQFGEFLTEEDIVRIEDAYGRAE